jgi:DNA-binding response OmpR family regulator
MRVLLIEDDSATAQSIELMLKSESFNVYTTDLGEEGIDLGKIYDYDIILLDLNLPDKDYVETVWGRGYVLREPRDAHAMMAYKADGDIEAVLALEGVSFQTN